MRQNFKLIMLVCLIAGSTSFALAHGSSFSYEETKDGYLIDIGYDEFIAADESVRFDFMVYPEDIESIEGEVFTDVWVTLRQDKRVFFAGGIDKPVFGATGFTYAFPDPGEYTLTVRFQNEGNSLVETEFPVQVIPAVSDAKQVPPLVMNALFGLGGLLIGFAGALFIPRKQKSI